MTLRDAHWISRHIPHQGRMCLLNSVEHWDDTTIVCHAIGHGDPDHPLRDAQALSVLAGIEYAAQAMALHGVLLQGKDAPARAGLLASVRQVRWFRPRLDDLPAPLQVEACSRARSTQACSYDFAVRAAGITLISGQASIFFGLPSSMGIRS